MRDSCAECHRQSIDGVDAELKSESDLKMSWKKSRVFFRTSKLATKGKLEAMSRK